MTDAITELSGLDAQDAARDREFIENVTDTWGWDGYHVEDAVSFARMYRRIAVALRSRLESAEREREEFARLVYRSTVAHCELAEGFDSPGASMWDVSFDAVMRSIPAEMIPSNQGKTNG